MSELEELLGPALFALPERPAAIIPIRPRFAQELLGVSGQGRLFARYEAGVRTQRAYFCSPKALSAVDPGALLFFYESLKDQGRGSIVACGRAAEVFVEPKTNIADALIARGVLDQRLDEPSFFRT